MVEKSRLKKFIYILTIVLIVGIPLIKLTAYSLYLAKIIPDAYLINPAYLLWSLIPILIVTYVYGIVMGEFKFKFTDILIYLLIITAFISTYYAIDIKKSIMGEYRRDEGLLTLVSYYLIFLNVRSIDNEKYKNSILNILLITGLLQSIYAILQVYTQFNFIKHYSKSYMAMGLNGNPNFFGSYAVMLTLLATSLYLIKKEKKYFFLAILFFSSICLASSTGPFLGFVIAFIFFIIVFHKQMKLKNILILLIVLIATYFFVDVSVHFVQEQKFKNTIDSNYNITSELTQTISNYKDSNIGNGRLQVWYKSIPIAKKYWKTGAGLDSFALVFPRQGYLVYDKAHNIYLQMLITNGLFALINYCILCLIIFIKGFKLKKPISIALFAAFVGYSIQAFSNISVVDVAPIFFVILGLLYTYDNKEKDLTDS